MVDSPPICLPFLCTYRGSDPNNPTNPNYSWVTLNIGAPGSPGVGQTYTINPNTPGVTQGIYDGTSVRVGMWMGNASDGYVWRIQRILSSPAPSATSVDIIAEDVNGFNAEIDQTGGLAGGGPPDNQYGYVFELNIQTALPALTAIDNPPNNHVP